MSASPDMARRDLPRSSPVRSAPGERFRSALVSDAGANETTACRRAHTLSDSQG
jgi:hypothetical protein